MTAGVKTAFITAGATVAVAVIGLVGQYLSTGPKNKDTTRHVFRIERIESETPLDLISVRVSINGSDHAFPAAYAFAQYEPNMAGGEYALLGDGDEFRIAVDVVAKGTEDRRLFPTNPPRPVELTYQFKLRQPITIRTSTLPVRSSETLRWVEGGVQRNVKEYRLTVHYSAS